MQQGIYGNGLDKLLLISMTAQHYCEPLVLPIKAGCGRNLDLELNVTPFVD